MGGIVEGIEKIIDEIAGERIWAGFNAHNSHDISARLKARLLKKLSLAIADRLELDEEEMNKICFSITDSGPNAVKHWRISRGEIASTIAKANLITIRGEK